MLKCKEVTELSSQSRERELTLQERLSVKMHLMMCSACRNFDKQMNDLSKYMKAFAKSDVENNLDQ